MALVPLFLSIWSFLLGGLAIAAGIVKAIDAADDSRGYSLFIVGVVAAIMGLFLMIIELWQTEGLQNAFGFVTRTWWGKGLYILILGLLVFDQPHFTFIFVAGIILMVFGLIYLCLPCCKVSKPEPII